MVEEGREFRPNPPPLPFGALTAAPQPLLGLRRHSSRVLWIRLPIPRLTAAHIVGAQ